MGACLGVAAVMFALRKETKDDMEKMRVELRSDIQGLASEIRTSLAELHASRGAMDAHAQFYRDANAVKKSSPASPNNKSSL